MSDITTLDAGRDDGLRTIGHISYALHAVVAVGAVLPGFQPGVALLVVAFILDLIKQGDADRSMYFLAQGSLQVFVTGGVPGSSRIAILRAGSVVGEPGLFNDGPRMANVEAMTACEVWALRGPRLEELSQRSPALVLEILRAAGNVMAVRMRANLAKQTPFS